MARIVFYEKTGCVNNTKQKKILSMAGHDVQAIDLVKYDWTKEELKLFFNELAVPDWFNKNAPQVTSGEVVPENFNEDDALEAMLKNHLLIKRPLMEIEGNKIVGFNKEWLEYNIGLNKAKPEIASLLGQNLEDCPSKKTGKSCD